MKKKTKKKLAKLGKKVIFGFLKLIFVYPAKGAWFLIKTNLKKNKEKKERFIVSKTQPKVEAGYVAFKELKNHKGDLTAFTNKLHSNKSTIGLILGARGTGKSAIGMRLLENFKVKSNKGIYALGFKEESLPDWIKSIKTIDEIQNNSVILIDEGGIEFSSRKSMSGANTFLSELLLISRHKDLSVIFITQNSANLEINVIRQADYLVMKPSSLLQKDFERKKIRDIYNSVQKDFDELSDEKGITYLYGNHYSGFVSNSLPSFWNENVSKGYSKR